MESNNTNKKTKSKKNSKEERIVEETEENLDEKEVVHAWWVPRKYRDVQETEKAEEPVDVILKFVTKQEQFSIPQTSISVKDSVGVVELNYIVSSFLEKAGNVENIPTFEFLIGGRVLVKTVGQHLTELGISYEATAQVEYFERFPPPSPKDNLEHDDWVSSVMNSDQWLLTGCYDNTVQIWSVSNKEKGLGKRAHKLAIPAHKAAVKAVAWMHNTSNNSKSFVSCSIDQTAVVWNWNPSTNIAQCVWECRGHTQSVECLRVEPLGTRFATGSWDNNIKIWEGADNTESDPFVGLDEEPEKKKIKKSKNERLKTPILTFCGHSENVSGVDWMDKNHILSCSWDHSIRMWDLQACGKVAQLSGNVAFFCLSYSPINRTVLAGCADRHIRLYDPRATEGSVIKNKFVNHSKWVPSVKWSSNNEYHFVSGGYDNRIKVWDSRSASSPLYNLLGHTDKVLSVDWSCPSRIASGSADCTALLYDA